MTAAASSGIDRSGGRIDAAFSSARSEGRPLIVPFVTAGYPTLDATVPIVAALANAGADLVEIGMPFSDPLADGPTIQHSSEVALANGMSVAGTLEIVRELRDGAPGEGAATGPSGSKAGGGLPIVLMGYSNPLYAFGLDDFLGQAAAAGVDGLIVADMPPDEAAEYLEGCKTHGLSATFLVAPNAPDERVRKVDEASTDFSYCVTVTGVTGARSEVQDRTIAFLQHMRELAAKPFVVGFGVKAPEHVRMLGPHADGVVIGSALIDAIDADPDDPAEAVSNVISPLREAARGVARSDHGSGGMTVE